MIETHMEWEIVIDNKLYTWRNAEITGKEIKELAGADISLIVYQTQPEWEEDPLIEDEEIVNLEKHPRASYLIGAPPHWTTGS